MNEFVRELKESGDYPLGVEVIEDQVYAIEEDGYCDVFVPKDDGYEYARTYHNIGQAKKHMGVQNG